MLNTKGTVLESSKSFLILSLLLCRSILYCVYFLTLPRRKTSPELLLKREEICSKLLSKIGESPESFGCTAVGWNNATLLGLQKFALMQIL